MAYHNITGARLTMSTRSLAWLQDLAHAPFDASDAKNNAERNSVFTSGYKGPLPTQVDFQQGIMPAYASSNIGISLSKNDSTDALEKTFCYGSCAYGQKYSNFDQIMCAFGPSAQYFENTLVNEDIGIQFAAMTRSSSGIAPGVIPGLAGVAAGTGAQYIPSNSLGFNGLYYKADLSTNPTSLAAYPAPGENEYSYETTNVWQMITNQNGKLVMGSPTNRYIRGFGPITPPSSWSRGSIHQMYPGEALSSAAVGFSANYGSIRMVRPYIDIGKARWLCTTQYLHYFNAQSGGEGTPALLPATGDKAMMVMADVQTSRVEPTRQCGWTLKLKYAAANTSAGLGMGGAPPCISVTAGSVDFTGEDTVQSSASGPNDFGYVSGFNVSISPGKPITVSWAALTHTGAVHENIKTWSRQYRYSPNPVPYTSNVQSVDISVECFGESMVISIATGGSGLDMLIPIAPQMQVYKDAWTTSSNSLSNSAASLIPSIQIDAQSMSGHFTFSPIAYQSWLAETGMFRYLPFEMNSNYVSSGGDAETQDISCPTIGNATTIEEINLAAAADYTQPVAQFHTNMLEPTGFVGAPGVANRYLSIGSVRPEMYLTNPWATHPDVIIDPRGANALLLVAAQDTTCTNWTSTDTLFSVPALGGPTSNTITINQSGGNGQLKIILDEYKKYAKEQCIDILTQRKIFNPFTGIASATGMTKKPLPCLAVWTHMWANTQFCHCWPGIRLIEWIATKQAANASNSIPINTEDTVYSNGHDNISSFKINYSLENSIIVKTLSLMIKNPNANFVGYFNKNRGRSSAYIYLELDVAGQKSAVKFSGFIKSMKMKIEGDGATLSIDAQDDFSFLMKTLNYPGEHVIDGWYSHFAISYLILRTGLKYDTRQAIAAARYPVGGNYFPRVGRTVITDIMSSSLSFSGGSSLESNLMKAIGPISYKSGMFFYQKENGMGDVEVLADPIWNENDMLLPEISSQGSWGMADNIQRDSINIDFNNTQMIYEMLLQSKDRHRGVRLWKNMQMGLTRNRYNYGYKNSQTFDVTGWVQTTPDLKEFSDNQSNLGIGTVKPEAGLTYFGLPPEMMYSTNNTAASRGGIGVFSSRLVNLFPASNGQYDGLSNFMYVHNTTISYDADTNNFTTNIRYRTIQSTWENISSWMQGPVVSTPKPGG